MSPHKIPFGEPLSLVSNKTRQIAQQCFQRTGRNKTKILGSDGGQLLRKTLQLDASLLEGMHAAQCSKEARCWTLQFGE